MKTVLRRFLSIFRNLFSRLHMAAKLHISARKSEKVKKKYFNKSRIVEIDLDPDNHSCDSPDQKGL